MKIDGSRIVMGAMAAIMLTLAAGLVAGTLATLYKLVTS